MLDLNFLPAKEQEAVKSSLIWLISRNVLTWILLVSVVASLMMLWSRFFLESKLADEQGQNILANNTALEFTDQIRQINNTLKEVEKIQAAYVTWSEVLIGLTQSIPENNRIDSIHMDSIQQTFSINGISDSREDLLALEESLKINPLVTKLESPLSNLLEPQNISFSFSGILLLRESVEEESEE